jgi:glycosyltransferase involved in cell wall biosynthesis
MIKTNLIVLIPHYNDPVGLQKSIDSIHDNNTVDVLVIDDGSSIKPNEAEFKRRYQNGRVFFKYLEINKGLSYALNEGVKFAIDNNYEYTGRLDCRDLCVENKFDKQLSFLQSNKNIYLLGTWAQIVDEENHNLYVLKHPTHFNQIKKKMYVNSMFVHPSVVLRTDVFNKVGLYDIEYSKAAQDYDLFFRIIKKVEAANYPEVLLIYETSSDSISTRRRKLQVKHRIKIILNNFYFGFYPIYGLIRNTFLYFLSRETTTKLKSILKK